MYQKHVVEGKLIRETQTHYITMNGKETCTWSKQFYRLASEERSA